MLVGMWLHARSLPSMIPSENNCLAAPEFNLAIKQQTPGIASCSQSLPRGRGGVERAPDIGHGGLKEVPAHRWTSKGAA